MTANDLSNQPTAHEFSRPMPPVIAMDDVPAQQNDCVEVPAAPRLSGHQSNSGEYCMLSILEYTTVTMATRCQKLRANNPEC